MQNFENIEGNKLLPIFQQLIRQRILVKVFLPKHDFESLTLVTESRDESRPQIFKIDAPAGLQDCIAETNAEKLSFEFTSTDRVTHHFDAQIETITPSDVSLRYPQFIKRHQQRQNFRVQVPYDSHAIVTADDSQIRMEIDNISLGGTYCYCPNKFKSIILPEMVLPDLQLIITLKNECHNIAIQRVQVRRVESRHRPKRFGVAFEFIQIGKEAKKQLVQQIYELQRAFLQNRHNILA